MLEIVDCRESGRMRAFFSLSGACGYLPAEAKYLKSYASFPLNPVSGNGPSAYLAALRDGKPVFRVLAFSDRLYTRETGRKLGFFSLFDGENDREAAHALLARVISLQRAWGNEEVLGPVSPDGGGFFHGLGAGDFSRPRGLFTGVKGEARIKMLTEFGFVEAERDIAFSVPVPGVNPLSDLAARAGARFGVSVSRANAGVWREKWARDIVNADGGARPDALLSALERLRPWVLSEYSFVAFAGGAPVGYLLSVGAKGAQARACTLFARKRAFSCPVTLVLVSALADACASRGARAVEASVVNAENAPSLLLIARLGGQAVRSYRRYRIFINQI